MEWIAWYRALGFEVMVLTNDCTDSSPQMLNTFEQHGWITHVPHMPQGRFPKLSAHISARRHALIREVDWVMICDVDEFLVIHIADRIQDILCDLNPDFLGMAINWRCFGSGGRKRYRDSLQTESFVRGALPDAASHRWFKSIFRRPLDFKAFDAHGPRLYIGEWGVGEAKFINSEGRDFPDYDPSGDHRTMLMPRELVTHRVIQLNHYIIKTDEDYSLKAGTPSASAGKNRYTRDFFRRHNRRQSVDSSARKSNPMFKEMHEAALALPNIRSLHHRCCAEHVARICSVAGQDPEQDHRYQTHDELARRYANQPWVLRPAV